MFFFACDYTTRKWLIKEEIRIVMKQIPIILEYCLNGDNYDVIKLFSVMHSIKHSIYLISESNKKALLLLLFLLCFDCRCDVSFMSSSPRIILLIKKYAAS